MRGGKQLLLLAALTLLVKCQQKLRVSKRPDLKQIFTGDLLYLSCENAANTVKWYLNDTELQDESTTLKIAPASSIDSGFYKCESSGVQSESLLIDVLVYAPSAALTIETGQPVMPNGSAVLMKIEKEDGISGWRCKVNRGAETKTIKLKLQENSVSLVFQPKSLHNPETIFWCTDHDGESRSNQIIVWTSDKKVLLETYPSPAVAGESLTLKCIVWGTDKVTDTIFYKNAAVIKHVKGYTHKINNIEKSDMGQYKCLATYKYLAQTSESSHKEFSNSHQVLVQVAPVRATMSEDMRCSCPSCDGSMNYQYYKQNGLSWTVLDNYKRPDSPGTYRCRALGSNMRTLPSVAFSYNPGLPVILILTGIFVVFALLVGSGCVLYFVKNRRSTPAPLYEQVGLRAQAGDGGYEALKKKEKEEGEYHTLGVPGAAGAEGGYEALKKKDKEEGEYHTLGVPGAAGAEGGYEALKKKDKEEGEYHTLGVPGAAGGEGGYEALKKKDKEEGEYHTLDTKKAAEVEGKDIEIQIV